MRNKMERRSVPFCEGSAAAAVVVVVMALAAAAGVAAAATEQNDDEDEPQAGIVVAVMEAHERSPLFKTLRYSMRRAPEWGLDI